MQTPRAIAVAFCLLATFSFPAIADSKDAKLLGTWLEPVFDATVTVTYRADHTFVGSGYFLGDKTPTTLGSGTWRIVRDQLITRFKGKETRRRIVSITENELQLEDSPGKIFTYKRTE
jgi:hypothetical protein